MRAFLRPAILLLGLLAASCGGREPAEKIAVLVNGEPITVPEVRAQRDATPGHDAKRAMESLIDRRLLLQRALEQHLDRVPGVEAALARARENILVQAYLEKLADSHYRYDPAAIGAFYREHPALFAQRRIYRLLELSVAGKPEDLERLAAKAREARTLSEVADWLSARAMPFVIGAATKPAEQIPLAMLPTLAAMRDGEIRVLPTGGGVSVVQVLRSELKPVSEAAAESQIRQHLWSRAGSEALPQELKWLRSKAQIEYRENDERQTGYRELRRPQPTAAGQVEVIEFFWYRCPHCYELEPSLARWAQRLPRDVLLRRVPVVFNTEWAIDARIFYALQALGEEERLRPGLYEAIHREGGRRLDRTRYERWVAEWLSRHGVDMPRFRAALESAAVREQVEQAKRMTVAYGIEGTPTLAIQGRYLVDAQAGSHAQILEISTDLVNKARQRLTALP